ncbi:hypothetical protein CH63R_02464 [Colletotrichum higginsianum IMI 349063]|uniref:C2H2-type domain-containing protein n=1 Tax=Colletotrichum higginsianum (strain IMI 349063) TaxID=759273 RepID=A0A1B7YPC7_COLHI|nr:hypothetical protein CH63R_02464 [Colletotrichum higginsianum IMI 349063]OBR13738.1 hypothetical protein CH63R_02464 [Colletotrichum higginsianum IMI 349063]
MLVIRGIAGLLVVVGVLLILFLVIFIVLLVFLALLLVALLLLLILLVALMHTSMVMSSNNSSGAGFRCMVPGCTANPISTKSNLDRHIENTHGPFALWVKMPCEKLLKFNPHNNRRHSMGCSNALCRSYEGLGETFFVPEGYERELVQAIVDTKGSMSPQDAIWNWVFVNLDIQFLDN